VYSSPLTRLGSLSSVPGSDAPGKPAPTGALVRFTAGAAYHPAGSSPQLAVDATSTARSISPQHRHRRRQRRDQLPGRHQTGHVPGRHVRDVAVPHIVSATAAEQLTGCGREVEVEAPLPRRTPQPDAKVRTEWSPCRAVAPRRDGVSKRERLVDGSRGLHFDERGLVTGTERINRSNKRRSTPAT
jgi:hypothetical protein